MIGLIKPLCRQLLGSLYSLFPRSGGGFVVGGSTGTGQGILIPSGTTAAPSLAFSSSNGTGIYLAAAGYIGFTSAGSQVELTLGPSQAAFTKDTILSWSSTASSTGAADLKLARDAAATLAQRDGTNAQTERIYNTYTDGSNYERGSIGFTGNVFTISPEAAGTGTLRNIQIFGKVNSTPTVLVQSSGNTGLFGFNAEITTNGSIALAPSNCANGQKTTVAALSELLTIAAAATTDTVIQMPANSLVLAVSVRVTTVIPTATTFTVGDSGSAARFNTAAVSTAANSTDNGTKAGVYYNATALAIRITPNLTPGAATGVVRVTIHYITVTSPTS